MVSSTKPIRDSCIVITGGASGLGHALCGLFSGSVHCIDVQKPKQPLPHVHYHIADVSSPEVQDVMRSIGPVDVLINNAGMMRRESLRTISYAHARAVFDVNVFGAWNVTRHATLAPDALVVFINSRHGTELRATPAAYSLSKNMLSLLARAFSLEGVRVKEAFLGPFEGGVSRHGHSEDAYARRTLDSAESVARLVHELTISQYNVLKYDESNHSYHSINF